MTCRTSTTPSRDRLARALLAGCAAIALSACGADTREPPRTERRGVDAFHSVDLRGAAEVTVQVGGPTSVEVTATPAALAGVRTTVHNGTLTIDHGTGPLLLGGGDAVKLAISVPELHAFAVNGAGNVRIDGVDGTALALVLQGAGQLVATGRTASLNARINGAGNMDLAGLEAIDATVAVNGAGHLSTRVGGSLQAEVNGVGAIRYAGSPQKLDTRINGLGSIAPASESGP